MARPPSLLLQAKLATNWYDRELAQITGMKRATVQAVLCERVSEHLTPEQKARLVVAVRDFVEKAQEALETMELFA